MTNLIQLEIADRRPFADGEGFGGTGAYERIAARALFRVDPLAPAQAGVTDIALAPRDGEGLVSFSADVFILQPADPALGNRAPVLRLGQSGNKRALQYFCDAEHSNDPERAAHAGNGFLFRRGYTIVFGAWQGDLLPGEGRMLLDLPVARHEDGPVDRTGAHRVYRRRTGRHLPAAQRPRIDALAPGGFPRYGRGASHHAALCGRSAPTGSVECLVLCAHRGRRRARRARARTVRGAVRQQYPPAGRLSAGLDLRTRL